MRYLAFFLALAPSLVLATPPWKVEWYRDDKCQTSRLGVHTGTGDEKGTFNNDVAAFKFSYDDGAFDMYIWDRDTPDSHLGMPAGSCHVVPRRGHDGWGAKKGA